MLELAVVMVVIGLLSWASFGAYETASVQRERDAGVATIRQLQTVLRTFAQRQGRLPCPDASTDGNGHETLLTGLCTAGNQLGWFPYLSVGLELPPAQQRVRYAVFRLPNANALADMDLAVSRERTGDQPGDSSYLDVQDLVAALNNLTAVGNANLGSHPYLTGDGGALGAVDCTANRTGHVAYWLVSPMKDLDADGINLDSPHARVNLCAVSPSAPVRWNYDDIVLAESAAQLAGWLRKVQP